MLRAKCVMPRPGESQVTTIDEGFREEAARPATALGTVTQTHRHILTDRHTESQRHRDILTDRHTESQRHRHILTDRHTGSQRHRHVKTQT